MALENTYNPYRDDEAKKWFEFDRSACHTGSDSAIAIETNTSDNALEVYCRLGHCLCKQCWENIRVTVSVNHPAEAKGITLYHSAQVDAVLFGRPVRVKPN